MGSRELKETPVSSETATKLHIDREAVLQVPAALFHKASTLIQADLYALEWQGTPAILKDYAGLKRGKRRLLPPLISWWGLRKEREALLRLEGLEGIPKFLGQTGSCIFLRERLEGKRLRTETELSCEFFEHLEELVSAMHERGVAHGDLRKANILVTPRGRPCIIDFETCVRDHPEGGRWRKRLFKSVCRLDRVKVLRLWRSYFPDRPLSEEEQALLQSETRVTRLFRFLRQNVYRPIRLIITRKHDIKKRKWGKNRRRRK